ncbi:MAG: hydroxyacid dehydrogenase [Myxococcota bacterium]
MNKHRVLVSDKLSERGLAVLRAAPEIALDIKVGLKPEELRAIIGSYEALAVRSATKVTRDIIEAGSALRLIGRAGVGVDNVDLAAAHQRGIAVLNTPGGNVVSTAEHALAMMFALARKIPMASASVRGGAWEKSKFQGREIFGKTLGIIGLGNIGKVVAERAQGLKMRVVAADPWVSAEAAKALGVEMMPVPALLAAADIVTLHVPLLDWTKQVISAQALASMKSGAMLVNCARGGLCDEAAVAEAVRSGHLWGAAFDVYAEEPLRPDNPLRGVENIILTPHLGASTDEAQERVAVELAEAFVEFFQSGVVKNRVSP